MGFAFHGYGKYLNSEDYVFTQSNLPFKHFWLLKRNKFVFLIVCFLDPIIHPAFVP